LRKKQIFAFFFSLTDKDLPFPPIFDLKDTILNRHETAERYLKTDTIKADRSRYKKDAHMRHQR